jgi:SAM-dependent methyltransferase
MSIINTKWFYEVRPKPSNAELEAFYKKVPLGCSSGYNPDIDDDEYYHRRLNCLESEVFLPSKVESILDIGCGEGFFLDWYSKRGATVEGIDFNASTVARFFPHLREKVHEGDLIKVCDELASKNKKYEFINATNVIEHVVDPILALTSIKKLMKNDGILRITVPNDFSNIQQCAVLRGYATKNYWVSIPAHLNYFNNHLFKNFLSSNGLKIKGLLSDFPIEFFLFHRGSNYIMAKAAGTQCHRARMEIENLISRQSTRALVEFRRGCAKAGIGRNLIAYCKSKSG